MRKLGNTTLYSATDLNGFLGCRHSTFLDVKNLEDLLPQAKVAAQMQLIQEKGLEHEHDYLESLKEAGLSVVEIPGKGHLQERVEMTKDVMRDGPDIIYQAALRNGSWHGFADFLKRVEYPSDLGVFSYEAIDTKLSKRPSPYYALQLCVYSDLLKQVQGTRPHFMSLLMGDKQEASFRFDDFAYYYSTVKRTFENAIPALPESSNPEPCGACSTCKWRDLCKEQWERDDHLSLVANIRRSQILHLEAAGVGSLRSLAQLDDKQTVPSLSHEILDRLKSQAKLQLGKRETREDRVEVLPASDGRGFERMPKPAPGDLFFDMEGDPLYPDGLEYLFGFYYLSDNEMVFKPFWAFDHEAEKQTFKEVMDFITGHLVRYPEAHIYHYNHYEETAFKRLSTRYGISESSVDDLLRNQKLVDLYKVVREAIRVSEPAYSIKNLETFYMKKRESEVASATDSIIFYEQWRETQDDKLLKQIRDYNEDDCRSTHLLRDWLLTLRPEETPWFELKEEKITDEKKQAQQEAEENRLCYERKLIEGTMDQERTFRELTAHLLEFHRRESKPQWWAMFNRRDMPDDELLEDRECLGALRADPTKPPYKEKRSRVYSYRFPAQETKFQVNDSCLQARTLERAGEIVAFDMNTGTMSIKRGVKKGSLPEALSVIPTGPLNNSVLKNAVYRFADGVISDNGKYSAIAAFLQREQPSIEGHDEGSPIVPDGADTVQASIQAIKNLKNSYLFIQGPPGAGKTYTSSHVIVELIRSGKRIGVSSNSHKAINNLLSGIISAAKEIGLRFKGFKKSSGPENQFNGEMIEDVSDIASIDLSAALFAGTAWLFARPEWDEVLDYLFIDEAGQVSLANLIAMGTSAKNIVLVGDKMQLGQPIQGVHPGFSGMSVLDYLLLEGATIPPDRGIFLETTWRMHEKVCRFISDAVYEGRLQPEKKNQEQALILSENAHPALMENGIRFINAHHTGCSQKSEVEGEIIQKLYGSLMEQQYRDRNGTIRKIGIENVLVVTPYNLQVNYLKSTLPEDARVGTVDKFQGQEAEVVLISMVTSSGEDLPRDIEFLYSKNRLNVAISRAKALTVMVANPNLLEISCHSIEQMRLVNTLCWVKEYSA